MPIFLLTTTWRLLQIELNWRLCKRTKDKQKIPDNAEDICKKTFFYFINTICHKSISKYFLVNLNQNHKIDTVLVYDGNNNIYNIKEAQQVLIHRKKEKKTFISMLSVDFGSCKQCYYKRRCLKTY